MHSVGSISSNLVKPFLKVEGGKVLSGHLKISGAKNSALVLMAASLLTKETIELSNIPELTDIEVMAELLLSTGAEIKRKKNTIQITTKSLSLEKSNLPYKLVHALRASFVCIGPILARLGEVKIPLPGGCRIGSRPIDEHIKGLKALGANVTIEGENVIAKTTNSLKKLVGTTIDFQCQSVGATETILMAATLAKGCTVIKNAAQEPEIQDLANLLNKMGARIKGAGSPEITIKGVNHLTGCSHKVIPDRIEAGTFLIASAITRCPLTISPVITEHLDCVLSKLKETGCAIEEEGESLKITPNKIIKAVDITTNPFPGFPTDLQAPFMALMATAKGACKIKETVFEQRMQHVGELKRMGGNIKLIQDTAYIKGVNELHATSLTGGDLRSSAAMVLASLIAKGTSIIQGLDHLDRGYENFELKLNEIGASIVRSEKINEKKYNLIKKESKHKHNFSSGSEVA